MPTRKVYETGDSIVVSLPRDAREDAGIEVGDTVIVEAEGGRITVAAAEVREAHRPDGGED